ncbi:MAG: hypothetical protein RJA99_3227 [Pseudomonadota bacterium]|jgi:hypothetical protein
MSPDKPHEDPSPHDEYRRYMDELNRRQMMNAYPPGFIDQLKQAEYHKHMAAQQAAMINQMASNAHSPPRAITVGKTQLREDDVLDMRAAVAFIRFAIEADEEMNRLWTAFKVARKLES